MSQTCDHSFDICKCECHIDENVRHVKACCDGKCPTCQQYIMYGCIENHKEKHLRDWEDACNSN